MLLLLYGPRNSGKKCVINHLVNSKDFNKLDYSDSIYETLVKLEKWKSNYITILPRIKDWDLYKKRPCARLVVLFAPSNSNWRTDNDDLFYSQILKYEEAYKIPNFGTLPELYSSLDACLTKIRPSWDMYFINLAINVSLRSNCMKGRVGCVIVKDNHVISTGYNGTPFNLPNCYENGCTRCNMGMRCGVGLDYCLCVHAEENALLFLGKERAKGSVLYVTRFPCQLCCRKIVQMELKEVVFMTEYGISDGSVVKIFESANINVRHVQI